MAGGSRGVYEPAWELGAHGLSVGDFLGLERPRQPDAGGGRTVFLVWRVAGNGRHLEVHGAAAGGGPGVVAGSLLRHGREPGATLRAEAVAFECVGGELFAEAIEAGFAAGHLGGSAVRLAGAVGSEGLPGEIEQGGLHAEGLVLWVGGELTIEDAQDLSKRRFRDPTAKGAGHVREQRLHLQRHGVVVCDDHQCDHIFTGGSEGDDGNVEEPFSEGIEMVELFLWAVCRPNTQKSSEIILELFDKSYILSTASEIRKKSLA